MELDYLEIFGSVIGLLYLWLEYKASIYLWIAGIIMPAIYIFIYYEAGLYADFGINIYYLIAAIYGWCYWMWGRNRAKSLNCSEAASQEDIPITYTPKKAYLPLTAAFLATLLVIVWLLSEFTDSNVVWLDSFTTALSIIGMWMLTRKYVEQWLLWIVVDIVCCGLYLYKGLYFTSVLYGLYTIIAGFGYLKWIRMMKEQTK